MKTEELDALVKQIKAVRLDDMPGLAGWSRCPCCDAPQVPEDWEPTYDEAEKIKSWTLAQLMAFRVLQRRSGIPFPDLLARTSGGVMPGIGGALYGDVGTIGVSNFHGMFIGIEPDGHTHS